MIARKLRIRGTVQGVGFRYALRREALRLGIAGWVRNRADGSVEALVHGESRNVDALEAWARVGPPAARVESVQSVPAGLEEHEEHAGTGFELLPTI